jgi:3-oxoacyl-[acyl-carrier protein] reductase
MKTMRLDLEGKKIFVSGSSGGIGYAIAQAFLEEGASVILHGRDADKLEERLKTFAAAFPDRVGAVRADLTDPKERSGLSEAVVGKFGGLDAAVFCVGNGNVAKGYDLTQEQWDAIFAQNLFANAHTASALTPALKKGNGASMCFIGSIAGLQHLKAPIGYAVAKSALDAYAKCLAQELAPDGVRVNIVHPGNVLFPGGRWEQLRNEHPEEIDALVASQVAMKRFGTPEEIAGAVVFLASAKASFITGASLVVDGGQLKTL